MSDIAIRQVHKSYGKTHVIQDLNLDVPGGEFVVLLGPSGCGKSTLLRMIAGLETITKGEISIAGKVVNALEPRERGCAMVFQNYALYPHMTVAQNIGYALKVSGMKRSERQTRIEKVADALGIAEFLNRKPGQLSGGQRQRVAMGRAMIREPRIFLYDEPLSNLDARLRVAMRVEIRKLHQRLGTTTLFVTHDQVEAMTLADRIVVMNKGVVEQVGKPAEIYSRPASTYVAAFVGTPGMNLIQAIAVPEKAVVRLADGQELPYDRQLYANLPAGPVTLGFRAENIEMSNRAKSVRAQFQFAEELGASRLLHATIGHEPVIVATDGQHEILPGETFHLSIRPNALQFFDATHGRRVESEQSQIQQAAPPAINRLIA